MTLTDIGRRVELVAMDSQFHDISLGLYERTTGGTTGYLVHTYSTVEGSATRLEFVRNAMVALGGMTAVGHTGTLVGFSCSEPHRLMARRIFLEATKTPSDRPVEARPLETIDRKTECRIQAAGTDGEYHLYVEGSDETCDRRAAVAAKGLATLAEAELVPETSDRVRFACGAEHDAAVGLLLPRALNVRAAMREVDEAASRGVLAPPSAQRE